MPDDAKRPLQETGPSAAGDCYSYKCRAGKVDRKEEPSEDSPVYQTADEALCLNIPAQCGVGNLLAIEARNWSLLKTVDGLLDGGDQRRLNGERDAVRHAVWNCYMARHPIVGSFYASLIGSTHEEDAGDQNRSCNPCDEKLMDLHNNKVGLELAQQTGTCEDLVLSNRGRLRTLPPGATGRCPFPGGPN